MGVSVYSYFWVWRSGFEVAGFCLGHFRVGSYRYRSLIEGLYYLIEAL